jgi:glutamate dehydrogenase (NAD(P)+)
VSYLEWVQNTENQDWSLERVNSALRRKMFNAVDSVVQCWREFVAHESEEEDSDTNETSRDLRTAALVLAIRRVAKITLIRGIWP